MTTSSHTTSGRATRLFLANVRHLGRLEARDELFRQELRTRLLRQAFQQTAGHTERVPHMETPLSSTARPRPSFLRSGTRGEGSSSGAAHGAGRAGPRRPHLTRALGARRAYAAVALVLALSGGAGYLRLSAPAPVSAQTVLSRAAAAMRLAPGEAMHLTYRVAVTPAKGGGATSSPPATEGLAQPAPAFQAYSTADVWVQAGASGAATMSSQTLTDLAVGAVTGETGTAKAARDHAPGAGIDAGAIPMLAHYIQIGQQVYGYDVPNNAITLPGTHNEHPGWMIPNAALDGADVTQELSALAQRSPGQVQLLAPRLLDGSPVDVVRVNGWTDAPAMRTTFYLDAQSFVLRGFDAVSGDPAYPTPAWQVRLSSYATVMATAVPRHTFTVNAPAGAHVEAFRLDLAVFVPVFTAVCHSPLDLGQLAQIVQEKRQSLLAACQASAPAVSRDDLVAALAAPANAALTAAAAAGQITPAQQGAAYTAQQQWLDAFVTTPGGVQPPQ